MKRKGIGAIVLVVFAAIIFLVWAASQQFVTGTVKRRVAIAEAGRRCVIQATTAVEEGVDMLISELNEPPKKDAPPAESMAIQFRSLAPGQVLEFAYHPTVSELPGGGMNVQVSEVHGKAFIADVSGEKGEPPKSFNCRKYKEFLIKWNKEPG